MIGIKVSDKERESHVNQINIKEANLRLQTGKVLVLKILY